MKKVILLSVFVLSLAFAGNVSAQAPAKKAPEKAVQAPAAKPAEAAKPAAKPAAAPAKEKKAATKKVAPEKKK